MRTFPILHAPKGCPDSFPWELLEPHALQASKNHSQGLARLAERGGLSPEELYLVMHDMPLFKHRISEDQAVAYIKSKVQP